MYMETIEKTTLLQVEKLFTDRMYDFPGIDEGIMGMAFIENVVRSAKDNQNKWTKFEI